MFQCKLIWMESLSLYSVVITITSFAKSVLNSGDVMFQDTYTKYSLQAISWRKTKQKSNSTIRADVFISSNTNSHPA